MRGGDTIVALSSGALPSGIAIVRCSGPQAFEAARTVAALPAAREAAFRRFRDPADDSLLDEGLLLRFDAPQSATGEDVVEFQLHGSRAIVERLLRILTANEGVRLAEPGEFTRRALENDKLDLIEAEALGDLLEAETEAQRKAALFQYRGGFGTRLHAFQERLLEASAMAEAAIDYVGDEEETNRSHELAQSIGALREEVAQLLALPERRLIRDGIRVAIMGPPNSGKSSLLNALVGYERAIVNAEAGTTRDTIEVPIRYDGFAYIFVDTAGIRDATDQVEQEGVGRSRQALDEADILLWSGDEAEIPDHRDAILLSTKADLGRAKGGLPVSSVTGEGIEALWQVIGSRAASLLPDPDGVTINGRQRGLLDQIAEALGSATEDPIIIAEQLREARSLLSALLGKGSFDDVLDRIFGRFCLGK